LNWASWNWDSIGNVGTTTAQRGERFVLFGLLAAGLALRLGFALLPRSAYLVLLEDDAWMVTSIARHLALGHGLTADGLHPTNGFHPLYPLTFGVLPYLLRPDALDFGFRANLIICALLNTIALAICYGLARPVARPSLALSGLAVVALNPLFIQVSVNAMETSLALLLLLLLWWVALVREPAGIAGGVFLGVLAGLASLARLDNLVAAGVLGAVLLWGKRGQGTGDRGRGGGLLRSLAYGGTALLVLLPYFARNVLVFGHLTPSSGRALAYMHSFRESFALSSGLQLVAYQPALDMTRAPAWLLLVGLGVLVMLVWRVWQSAPQHRRLFVPLVLYALALTFYYAYLQQQGRPRYYVGVGIIVVLLCVAWLSHERVFARLGRASVRVGIALAVGVIILNSVLFYHSLVRLWNAPYLAQPSMYQAARWIADNLPPDARLAAQNSGVFQYYSEHVVLNFDGKLNHKIIPVLERRELDAYLRAEGVEYIVDLPGVARYIEYYSSNLSVAPSHNEMTMLDRLRVYALLVAGKVWPDAPPVVLDVREPERVIHPFSEVTTIVKEFPLPNNPAEAVTIYRLDEGFGR
jgi:hypothetical protein